MRRLVRIAVLAALGYAFWELFKRTRGSESAVKPVASGVVPKAPPPKTHAPSPAASERNGSGPKPSKADLYARAQELGIEGRSKMSRAQLERAIADAG